MIKEIAKFSQTMSKLGFELIYEIVLEQALGSVGESFLDKVQALIEKMSIKTIRRL